MDKQLKHTPLPWYFEELRPETDGLGYIRCEQDNLEISHHGDTGRSREENLANAAFTIEAVSNHARLTAEVERLTEALSKIKDHHWHELEPNGADVPDHLDAYVRELLVATVEFQNIARTALSSTPTETRVEEPKYLVWSNEHNAWWRAERCGYVNDIRGAGIYSRTEAVAIARSSRNGWALDRTPSEIAVSLNDIPSSIVSALSGEAGE